MIGKAKSIDHGHGDLRYITGESVNKKHPEKIFRLYDNLMPSSLNAVGVWDCFKLSLSRHGAKMKNNIIRMEISPAMEHTKDYTMDDWRKLLFDTLTEFDNLVLKSKSGKVFSEKTNLLNSKYTAWLHFESDSGIPHIHIAALRIDGVGHTNNDHGIDIRARRAAEIVAQKRGWTTAREIRLENIAKLQAQCESVLKEMQAFDIDDYFNRLGALEDEYHVDVKRDKEGKPVRYVLYDGYKKYKASDIGKGRHFTVSQLQRTWEKLHPELAQAESNIAANLQTSSSDSASILQHECKCSAPTVQKPCTTTAKPLHWSDYAVWKPNTRSYDYTADGKTTRFYLPNEVMDYFDNEFDSTQISNWDDLTQKAVELFVGIIVGPTEQPTVGTGGGGSSSDLPWRDKDEDDMAWARRCAHYAARCIPKKRKFNRSL